MQKYKALGARFGFIYKASLGKKKNCELLSGTDKIPEDVEWMYALDGPRLLDTKNPGYE